MKLLSAQLLFVAILWLAPALFAQTNNAVTSGEFIIEPATSHNLGFE